MGTREKKEKINYYHQSILDKSKKNQNMLSKIKSAASAVAEVRNPALTSHTSNASDNEEEIDNDTNNNNNNNINNNQHRKKTQDELLDIVEISRKRRISKDSADSLTSFIRWSFSHIDPSIQRLMSDNNKYHHLNHHHHHHHHSGSNISNKDEQLRETPTTTTPPPSDEMEDMLDDKDDDWSHQASESQQEFSDNNKYQVSEQLLRQHAKFSTSASGGGSSAANLTLLKANANDRHLSSGSLLNDGSARGLKRPRMQQEYSPERKFSHSSSLGGGGNRKSSSYLGNVVERLHQQQQHQQNNHQLHSISTNHQMQHQQLNQLNRNQLNEVVEHESGGGNGAAGLSFHLQQFLQQQTSLEDLCSSVGLDDSNQLVLAAAIHRALVDSVAPGQLGRQLADTKSTASSNGSNSSSSASTLNNTNSTHNLSHTVSDQHHTSSNTSGANLHLIDSLDRQRRAYNTRAALHGITPMAVNRQTTTTSSGVAMNMSNRVQQQRHAQAAAALSALASAGATHSLQHLASGANSATPIVDFKCDTCPSSFDDRHRLMQHQSIHLELKKDWFTETPVDEVMKIFNRRRGEFLCNICNLRFEATLDYDQHNHSVHGPRPYCCQFCGNGTRTFKCWRQYLNHLYDHRYIFSCTIDDCDFTVNRRDSLRFHIFRFHLNCQLPQNQQHQPLTRGVSGGHNNNNLMLGDSNNKWPGVVDDDEDTENEMNVAD